MIEKASVVPTHFQTSYSNITVQLMEMGKGQWATQALHHPPSSSLYLQGDSVGSVSPHSVAPEKEKEKKESIGSTRAQPAR